ncbi:MAG: aldo/keto reductase [Hyphomicrobiales bacterium]
MMMTSIPLINGIPAIGLGTYPLTAQQCVDAVHMAVELGYRHIDTAQMYGNEADVGRAIASCGQPRASLFVTTKVDPSNLTRSHFADSVKKSVQDLGGPADLLLIHWPPPDDQVDEALDLLAAEKARGNAHRIGVSNFPTKLLRRAVQRLGKDVSCNQVEFQPLLDQGTLKRVADELSVPLVAYSPIARGKALEIAAVQEIAKRLGRPPSEIVLRWIVQQGVIVIPMTTKRANAASNLNIFSFTLSEAEMKAISAVGTAAGRTVTSARMTGRWDV